MTKRKPNKILLYAVFFIFAAVAAYFMAVPYFVSAPTPDDALSPGADGLTPEERDALLNKFKDPNSVPPLPQGSSAVSDREAEDFVNQNSANRSAITPEERRRFLEQDQ